MSNHEVAVDAMSMCDVRCAKIVTGGGGWDDEVGEGEGKVWWLGTWTGFRLWAG